MCVFVVAQGWVRNMNKTLKTILLGLIVWAIPFMASIFVWDTAANGPAIDVAWFYALMGVTGALGFSIAAYYQFRNVQKDPVAKAWMTGIIWYFELILLDLIFLVGLFSMTMQSYYHLLLTYLGPLILCVAVGYIKK
jgi:hypothetical protein